MGDLNRAGIQKRLAWLQRWSMYYRAIATSEMVSHQFLPLYRTLQRVAFANGVVATFNMGTNEFCVTNVTGFSGGWEKPKPF